MKKYLWACFVALLAAGQAVAGEVGVSDAWARATAPGQDAASVQMTLTSNKAGAVVAASSAAARSVELHSMVMDGNMMKMRAIEQLALPAKKPVSLADDGYHLMLIGIKKPLKEGDKVPFMLTVRFADGSKETVKAEALVKPLATMAPHHHEHHHH